MLLQMSRLNLDKIRILSCATDAGGARNIGQILSCLTIQSNITLLGARTTVPIFVELGLDVHLCSEQILKDDEIKRLIAETRANLILVGATRFFSLDRRLVQAAKMLKVTSVVILDEWYYYANRFLDSKGEMTCLPDIICCQDQLALSEAVDEGVPEAQLKVTGSPALSALWNKRELFEKMTPPEPECLRGLVMPRILFLSETHAADYGEDEHGGLLGPFLGYTEETVALDLLRALHELNETCSVVEKLHPAADPSYVRSIPEFYGSKVTWKSIVHGPLHELIWHSDLVIGMRSMALVEAALLGKPTVSYQPGLREPHEPSTAERLKLAVRLESIQELKLMIKSILFESYKDSGSFKCSTRPNFAPADAVARVFGAVFDFMQKNRRKAS